MTTPTTPIGWAEVLNSTNATTVHMAASLLESEGIAVTIEHELVNEIPGIQCGVSMLVPVAEAERAVALLAEANFIPYPSSEATAPSASLRSTMWRYIIGIIVILALLVLVVYINNGRA